MAESNIYYNSFLLSFEVRELNSTATFKRYLNRVINFPPKCFSVGERHKFSTQESKRNAVPLTVTLFIRNGIDSPSCTCGWFEDTHHYFFKCPYFTNERNVLLASLLPIYTPSLIIILFGDKNYHNKLM